PAVGSRNSTVAQIALKASPSWRDVGNVRLLRRVSIFCFDGALSRARKLKGRAHRGDFAPHARANGNCDGTTAQPRRFALQSEGTFMDKQTLKALGKGLRQRWPVEDHLPLDIQIQLLRLV